VGRVRKTLPTLFVSLLAVNIRISNFNESFWVGTAEVFTPKFLGNGWKWMFNDLHPSKNGPTDVEPSFSLSSVWFQTELATAEGLDRLSGSKTQVLVVYA